MGGAGELDAFDAGRCADGYALGLAVGRRFAEVIRSRMRQDLVLREQLLPFAATAQAQPLLAALQSANRQRYPRYWDELVGTADGSGVPLLHVILVNFRKEVLPFIPKEMEEEKEEADGDCSDVLIVSDSTAIAAHNEDGDVALLGHTYLVRATLPDGASFTAYTCAGELPSCAFGFNTNGVVKLSSPHPELPSPHRSDSVASFLSGLHAELGSPGERRDRRGRHCPELRVPGPARSEEPRGCNAQGLFTSRLSRPQLQPDGRKRAEDRQRRDRLREPVRRPRGRRRALLPRQHVPASPSEAGAGRELDEQGEESCAVFVSSGLQRGGALAAGRHS